MAEGVFRVVFKRKLRTVPTGLLKAAEVSSGGMVTVEVVEKPRCLTLTRWKVMTREQRKTTHDSNLQGVRFILESWSPNHFKCHFSAVAVTSWFALFLQLMRALLTSPFRVFSVLCCSIFGFALFKTLQRHFIRLFLNSLKQNSIILDLFNKGRIAKTPPEFQNNYQKCPRTFN